MANLSVRVPVELQRMLDREATASRRPRSDLVREAIAEYVTHRARERELAAMERAARAMADAAAAQRGAEDVVEEFLAADLEALERGEGGPPAGGGARS